ncbi:MAG: enolase C-terminal domain-like protein [Casimicrobiaceae bacterium]
MTEAPRFVVREIELYERPVKLRLPFRFGIVTLTECPQAFVRARVEFADGDGARGAAAEMLAPKWFDKNPALTNENNFDQLRDVLRMARAAYLSDASLTSAFGHFARHYDSHRGAAAAKGYNPLLANYGPALIDRAVLDALCRSRGVSFYCAMRANLPGIGRLQPAHSATAGDVWPPFAGFDFDAFLQGFAPATSIEARHTVGMVDAITADDLEGGARVGDGLPETLEEVIAVYGHRYFKLKVGGKIAADLPRLKAIAAVLDRIAEPYFVTLDGNEQFDDAQGLAELAVAIRGDPALARLWRSVLFIEQPIARSVALEGGTGDLRRMDLGRPVIIDESDGELDAFVRARERGYAGVSSKTCKGLYKSILNAARCAAWNAQAGDSRYFMSAEDLTTQAGLSVQQDLALVNLLGIAHVERNGHHYVNGMAALPRAEQDAFLAAHPDLYEFSHGAARLRITRGRIDIASLGCPGFASAAMPAFADMQAIVGV